MLIPGKLYRLKRDLSINLDIVDFVSYSFSEYVNKIFPEGGIVLVCDCVFANEFTIVKLLYGKELGNCWFHKLHNINDFLERID